MRLFAAVCLAAALHVPLLSGAGAAPAVVPASPAEDLYFEVRSAAESPDPAGMDGALAEAVSEARRLGGTFGPPGWGPIDARAARCESARDLPARFADLPESLRIGGRTVALRAGALSLAERIAEAEPAFLGSAWPARRAALTARARGLADTLAGPAAACVAYICETLALADSFEAVPIHLVTRAPRPGGVTFRARGGAVCVVGLENAEGSLLVETALHEMIHGLDTVAGSGVLAELGRRLEEAGVPRADPRSREALHAIVFVQAAESVRRLLDPRHVHLGDARGAYARSGEITAEARRAWTEHLDGTLTRDEALRRIAAAAAAAPISAPASPRR